MRDFYRIRRKMSREMAAAYKAGRLGEWMGQMEENGMRIWAEIQAGIPPKPRPVKPPRKARRKVATR